MKSINVRQTIIALQSHLIPRRRTQKVGIICLVILLLRLCDPSAFAANISWATPGNISSDADVSTRGTLVRAANLTLSTGTINVRTTVNGVTFVQSPFTGTITNLTNGDTLTMSDTSAVGAYEGFGGDTPPFNTLSNGYRTLLQSGYYNDGDVTAADQTSRITLMLRNLTVGVQYEFQVWVNDYRVLNMGQHNPGLVTIVSDGTNAVTLQQNVQDQLGGTGQYVTGTFTADAATQQITLTGGNLGNDPTPPNASPIVNAYQVRRITAANSTKPRVIVMTDGEVDDKSSMLRFLLYTCDFDVAGIIQTNSVWQKNGHSGDKWIEGELQTYAQVLPNLRVHNPDYPDSSVLLSLIRTGNENTSDLSTAPASMLTQNTPGEQMLIQALLDADPRPIHVTIWGGANTLASALWKIKSQFSTADFTRAMAKLRAYSIWYQDGGGLWIENNIREAYMNEANQWYRIWDYQSLSGPSPDSVKAYMNSNWVNANLKTNHGAYGALYPQTFISEGDTPSFLHLINNGLQAYQDYTLGGWGGRSAVPDPVNKPNLLTDSLVTNSPDTKNPTSFTPVVTDDGDTNKMFWRWIPAAQNDFAARVVWTTATTYSAANHQPVAQVTGGQQVTVVPGQTVRLDASGSSDPDANTLSYSWWQYYDADSVSAVVPIQNASSVNNATFVVPNEPGKQIHIILEVTDNGSPSLTSYRRVIYTIATSLQSWRLNYFGTFANSGTAADAFDANGDGESNLLEFATGQSPWANTLASSNLQTDGTNLGFTYTRSRAALADGMSFAVEWSNSLNAGTWGSSGVTEQILSDNGVTQTVKASVPVGSGGSRFVHLQVRSR